MDSQQRPKTPQASLSLNTSNTDSKQTNGNHNLVGEEGSNQEIEVDQLRAKLAESERKLKEKSVEVEKSTNLFSMFD